MSGFGRAIFWTTRRNLRAEVKEISGVLAGDLPGALREMELVASGSRSQGNFLYVADISPEAHERLTEEQWREAVDLLEEKMELQGASTGCRGARERRARASARGLESGR